MRFLGKYSALFLLLFLNTSCHDIQKQKIQRTLKKSLGKELFYSSDKSSVLLRRECKPFFIDKPAFVIFNYVDSLGCTSCKLQLAGWKKIMEELDTDCKNSVQLMFLLHPKKIDEIKFFLERDDFCYPVFVDKNDDFVTINQFPIENEFQTFLLNGENKILAVGNPILNPKVKELYLKIIQGKKGTESKKQLTTEIEVKEQTISLGRFDWKEEKRVVFKIKNIGDSPLVINDVSTSCGCTSVDYPKEPVRPGESVSLQVNYKAEHPEHFDKTVTVYCNANPSLVRLKITGDAE